MTKPDDTIRVVIPLTIRKRNRRPKILPPQGVLYQEARSQDPHILKALGRAWAWRRRLECGEVSTAGELAGLEGVTERFVSRTVRLAYLAPDVLEWLIISRMALAVPVNELVKVTGLPWGEQITPTFSYENDSATIKSIHATVLHCPAGRDAACCKAENNLQTD